MEEALVAQVRDTLVLRGTSLSEPNRGFISRDYNIRRYLAAKDCNVQKAADALTETLKWREAVGVDQVTCKWCEAHAGYHSMRQVGHDIEGRPVIYSCFRQIARTEPSIEYGADDVTAHVVYCIEQADRSAPEGRPLVFVLDCSGIESPYCSVWAAKESLRIIMDHYPEKLHALLCVNQSPLFKSLWHGIRPFISERTHSKMNFLDDPSRRVDKFRESFGDELAMWLNTEISLNALADAEIERRQRQFWLPIQDDVNHDPRGCPAYLRDFVVTRVWRGSEQQNGQGCNGLPPSHVPHPNIAMNV